MNFQDPKCLLVEPKYLEFIPTGCHSSVSNCDSKASLRVVFRVDQPTNIHKSILLIEILNIITNIKQTYFISIPEGKCNCEPECFVSEIVRDDYLYMTVIFNNLIEGDNHQLQACIDYIQATPTPTVTPTISITPSITPTISFTPTVTPTISVTPTVTPTISVTPTVTPTITVTASVTPSITPTTSSPVSMPYANYGGVANWNGTTLGNVTTIGSNGPTSYYGTYDQHGNAAELVVVPPSNLIHMIGGDYQSTTLDKNLAFISSTSNPRLGFRLVSTINRDGFTYVGNPVNSADGNNYGSVDYAFYISKGMVTCGQFAKFLNSVFKSTTALSALWSTPIGITRYGSGSSSSPYVWIPDPNMFNKPVTNVWTGDVARYCNWILAGEPFNLFASTNYYNNGDAYTNISKYEFGIKNLLASLYIPELNQWYKAAFYDASLFGNAGGYWDYATRSDTAPSTISANSSGDGPFISTITTEPEPLKENSANYLNMASWDGQTGNTTTVGTNGTSSEYDCYDMSGNVREWTDTRIGGDFYILGGSWAATTATDLSSQSQTKALLINSFHTYGLRIGTTQNNPAYNYNFVLIGDTTETVPNIDGRGVVNYNYYLSKYQITNNDYIEFLNAVAVIADPNGLFGDVLQSGARSGIIRSGTAGSYVYTTKTYYANKPVVGISGVVAMRFCNWLHNGKPSGQQNNATTEDGAYTISIITGANPPSISRNTGALYFLPSENEWIKAAFYKRLGNGTYHTYATKSDLAPRRVIAINTNNQFKGNGVSH